MLYQIPTARTQKTYKAQAPITIRQTLSLQMFLYINMLKLSLNYTINLFSSMKRICTHDGRFHCDEVLACTLLTRYTNEYQGAEIVRSREPAEWEKADIVVDVGGKYQPPKWLDHHQIEFEGTYPNHGIRLSSAGLTYLHFPEIIPNAIQQILLQHKDALTFQPNHSQEIIDQIREKIYKDFIIFVDANDNGVEKVRDKDVSAVPSTLWARVSKLNPMWWEESTNEMLLFKKAMEIAGEQFESEVKQAFLGSVQTKQIVKEAYKKRKEAHPSGRIIVLGKYVPWQRPVFDIEQEEKTEGQIIFVVFPEKSGQKWRIQGVPKQEGSFELRQPLKEGWRGVKDEQKLKQLSGLNDIFFVHATGFIGGAVSLQSTIKMGALSMQ